VSRRERSVFASVMMCFTMLVAAGYAVVGCARSQCAPSMDDTIPCSVRSSPGGYRSYHFWHDGYHGGK